VSKIQRLQSSDRIFFVTVNLRRGLSPFSDQEYRMLIGVLKASRQRLGFALCGYVLMPDHWHALIWPFQPLTISQVIHDIKKVSALRLHRMRNTSGAVWQRQFWDRFVRRKEEFSARLDYMRYNPVRRGLVKSPEEWRWSSHNGVRDDSIAVDDVQLPEDYRA
jgi:REP element-mobilizing transposase RayT